MMEDWRCMATLLGMMILKIGELICLLILHVMMNQELTDGSKRMRMPFALAMASAKSAAH
jgi:hypothetical protein